MAKSRFTPPGLMANSKPERRSWKESMTIFS
jgi:hypothetical protein